MLLAEGNKRFQSKQTTYSTKGKPINETVAQHGPFVMNSAKEIQDAFNDYRKTKFGGWPWSRYDNVHSREIGRFAKYSDGREEIK